MRILLISPYALPHVGGVEVAVDALAREFVREGHDVTHAATGAMHEDAPYRAVRLPATDAAARLGLTYPFTLPHGYTALRRLVDEADVVNAHGSVHDLCAIGLRMARRRGRLAVLTEHATPRPRTISLPNLLELAAIATFGRIAARSADAIVTVSEATREPMRRLAPHARIVTIGNGIDTTRFHPATPAQRAAIRARLGWDERPRVLFAGRLHRAKRADLLADAARLLPDVVFVFAGPGALDDPPPNAQLLGAQPSEELADLYRAADLFVLPSARESFSLTVYEAAASGLPVIVCDAALHERLQLHAHLAAPEPRAIADAIRGVGSGEWGVGTNHPPTPDSRPPTPSWTDIAREYLKLFAELR